MCRANCRAMMILEEIQPSILPAGRRVPRSSPPSFMASYTCNNSVTVRQKGIITTMFLSPIFSLACLMALHSRRKASLVLGGIIPGGAAPADHGVFFCRFKMVATQQVEIFIALKIRKTYQHFVRVKGSSYFGNALR